MGACRHSAPPERSAPASRRRQSRGQALVEVALTLPLLLTLGLGVADLGRAFSYSEAASNAASQGASLAALGPQQSTGDSVCAGTAIGPATARGTIGSPSAPITSIVDVMGTESSSNGQVSGSTISGAQVAVTWHCTGNRAVTDATATSTDPTNSGSAAIEVEVQYRMLLITPLVGKLLGSQSVLIRADVSQMAEY